MKKEKRVTISMAIPVFIDLDVSWDDGDCTEDFTIQRAELSPTQNNPLGDVLDFWEPDDTDAVLEQIEE